MQDPRGDGFAAAQHSFTRQAYFQMKPILYISKILEEQAGGRECERHQ